MEDPLCSGMTTFINHLSTFDYEYLDKQTDLNWICLEMRMWPDSAGNWYLSIPFYRNVRKLREKEISLKNRLTLYKLNFLMPR